jgi:integrase
VKEPDEKRKRGERGEGSVYEDKSKGLWYGEVSATVDGRCVLRRIEEGCKTRSLALTRLRQLKLELATNQTTMQPDRQTVGRYVESYLDALTIAESTILRYRSLFENHFKTYELHRLTMDEVKVEHVLAHFAALRADGRSDSTVKKLYVFLHSAFEAKRRTSSTFRNPCDLPKSQIPKYKPERKGMPFDVDKETAFLNAPGGNKWEALYVLGLDAGMRQGEIFALEWSDFDWKGRTIFVQRTLKDGEGGLTIGETKGKQNRKLKVSEGTIQALKEHRRNQASGMGLQRLVFPNEVGGYLSRQNFNDRDFGAALDRAQEQTELDFSIHTFHDLRHTMATLLLQEGEPVTRVSQRLGHSSVKTTLDYYAHAMPQDEDRPAARFEERRNRAVAKASQAPEDRPER